MLFCSLNPGICIHALTVSSHSCPWMLRVRRDPGYCEWRCGKHAAVPPVPGQFPLGMCLQGSLLGRLVARSVSDYSKGPPDASPQWLH